MGTFGQGGGATAIQEAVIRTERLPQAGIVLHDITIIESKKRIEVPEVVYIQKEQTVYKNIEEEQTKYNTVIKDTVRYVERELESIKYVKKEEETIKYIPKDKEVEVPKYVEKIYEIPKVKEVPLEVVTIKNMEAVNSLISAMPVIMQKLNDTVAAINLLTEDTKKLETRLSTLRDIKLVEQIVSVPKLEWITQEVDRIIWKDVVRERPV